MALAVDRFHGNLPPAGHEAETMTLEQRLLETLHALPPEQQAEVVDFAAFLKHRLDEARQPASDGLEPLPMLTGRVPVGWKDAVYDAD
jgi:hypothetical protein